MDLLELAERCEKATGPDRELDAEITVLLAGDTGLVRLPTADDRCAVGTYWVRLDSGTESLRTATRWTASLDSAMTLVPEGLSWRVIAWPKNTRGFKAGALVEGAPDASGATTALALCAAALRARASGGQHD